MTQREMYNYIISKNAEDEQIVDFCKAKIEQLDKKAASGSGKPTPKQRENEKLKEEIIGVLADNDDGRMTATEIAESLCLSVPKVSALLRQLRPDTGVGDGRVVREKEGKKIYYSLAE